MELFVGSLVVFVGAALAMGIGTLLQGRPMHGGCRSLPRDQHCKFQALCGGACRGDRE